MSESGRLSWLLDKNQQNACSKEELSELYHLLAAADDAGVLPELDKQYYAIDANSYTNAVDWPHMYASIISHKRSKKRRQYYYLAAAAIIAGLIAGAIWLLPPPATHTNLQGLALLTEDKVWQLDSTPAGTLPGRIVYTPGKLTYPTSYNGPAHTLQVPAGKQFQLELPDGTRIWLNAATTITYQQRNITLIGEGYFEVSSDAHIPFTVALNDSTRITVLGTHFTIQNYTNEPAITTTLLQGKIAVQKGNVLQLLQPGQQAVITAAAPIHINNNTDTLEAIAWKNGYFECKNASLANVMRQFERWYNIEVKFEGNIPAFTFNGRLDKGLSLEEALSVLKEMNIRYRVEKKVVIIY